MKTSLLIFCEWGRTESTATHNSYQSKYLTPVTEHKFYNGAHCKNFHCKILKYHVELLHYNFCMQKFRSTVVFPSMLRPLKSFLHFYSKKFLKT